MEKRDYIQKQAVECIQKNDYTGLYVISPRVGKTKIVIDALGIKWKEWNIEIWTPREDINGAWLMQFGEWGQPLEDMGVETIPLPQCFASLKKASVDLDLMIIDEPQALSVAQMEWIKKKNPKRLLLITGTANSYTRGKLQYYLGIKEAKFEYSIEQAILDGIISNFHVYIVKLELDDTVKSVTVGNKLGRFKVTEKQNYVYLSTMFDEMRLLEKLDPSKIRAKEVFSRKRAHAIYISKKKQEVAKSIVDKISERVLVFTTRTDVADYLSPFSYHSKNKGTKKDNNLLKFIGGEINTLSVVQMSDMGITFPALKHEVVHQLQSNSDTSIQKFLRTCNLEGDKEAVIIVTVYKDTMDETWATKAIEGVPEDKVTWLELEELDDLIQKLR